MKDIDEEVKVLTVNSPARLRLVVTNPVSYEALKEAAEDIDTALDGMSIELYAFMMGRYKRAWMNPFAEEISFEVWQSAWMMSMNGLTLEQVEYAKRKISSQECYVDLPPNAGQFRSLCKSMPDHLRFQSSSSLRIEYDESPEAEARRLEKKAKAFEGFKELAKKAHDAHCQAQYQERLHAHYLDQEMLREEENIESYNEY